jgi:hypothetical protein
MYQEGIYTEIGAAPAAQQLHGNGITVSENTNGNVGSPDVSRDCEFADEFVIVVVLRGIESSCAPRVITEGVGAS